MRSTTLLQLLLCTLVIVRGDYRIEVKLEHYSNPTHLQADGECCTPHYYSQECSDCNNRFTLCVLPYATVTSDIDAYAACSGVRLSYTTGVVGILTGHADNMSFVGATYIDPQNNITNPLLFTGSDAWPGKFQLVIRVNNWRNTYFERPVDFLVENWVLPINTNQSRTLTGLKGNSRLTVSVKATCTGGLLCGNCTRICVATPTAIKGKEPTDIMSANSGEVASGLLANSGEAASGNDPDRKVVKKNGLTIGFSVAGAIAILLLLALIVIVIAVCFVKKRSLRKGSNLGHYQAVPTDDDCGSVRHQVAAPNIYEGLSTTKDPVGPASPGEDRVLHYPDSARTGQPPILLGRARNTETLSAEYSVITRQNLDLSPAHSLEDIQEASDEDEVGGAEAPQVVESGYSMIRQEDMEGYVSEDMSAAEDDEFEEEPEERTEESVAAAEEHSRPRMATPPSH